MAYTINRYDATLLVSLTNNTLDTTSTSLTLIGETYVGFGEQINENYVHLLENFRGITAPSNPLEGQTWYDNNTNIMKFYDGVTWTTFSDTTHNHTFDGLSNVTITTIASGEIPKWNGAVWINNTLAEAGISAIGHTHTAANITDFDTEVSNNTNVVANTAKVTNATHTGDVTGDTALSIAANVVGANELNVTGNGLVTQYLRSDADGSFTWDTPAGGGASVTVATSPPGSPTEGDLYWDEDNGRLYIYYTDVTPDSQWVDASPPVAGVWIETGNDIYSNNSGNVGIGAAPGAFKLDVSGTSNFTALATFATVDINGGNIDGASIATSDVTVGAGKTLNVSAGTLTLAANQIAGSSVLIATSTTRGSIELATLAEYRSKDTTRALTSDVVFDAAAEVTITYGATTTADMSTFLNGAVTMTGAATLDFTNIVAGQSGHIRFIQDATGTRILSFTAECEFAGGTAPTLTTTANAEDLIFYKALTATRVFISTALDIS